MRLVQRQIDIINTLCNANQTLANGDEGQRRQLSLMMCGQIAFEFGPDWGSKISAPGHPESKDSIAYNGESVLQSWDWQDGTTRKVKVNVGDEGGPIGNQIFIPVEPRNWLKKDDIPPDHNGDDKEPDPIDLPILKEILNNQNETKEVMVATLDVLGKILDQLHDLELKPYPPIDFPNYEGKLGVNLSLHPKK